MTNPEDWRKGKNPPLWDIQSDEIVANFHSRLVRKYAAQHPDGRHHDFFIVDAIPDWIQCIALTKNNEIVLVSQYRAGIKDLTLELPGGGIDKNEDVIQSLFRELREETGYTGSDPVHLYTCYPNPAMQTNRVYFYLLQNCEKTYDTDFDPEEDLTTHLLPLNQLDQAIKSNIFQHAMTLEGLLLFQRWLKENLK